MQVRIRRLSLEPALVANHVFNEQLPPEVALQAACSSRDRVTTCTQRSPISSTVSSPQCTRRGGLNGFRTLPLRVVVRDAHHQRRTRGQTKRFFQPVDVLPPEVPIRYSDQRSLRAVGKLDEPLEALRQQVRVRLKLAQLDVNRQDVAVLDDVLRVVLREYRDPGGSVE